MGREIREVPAGWEHPKDADGSLQPLYDHTYEDAVVDWQKEHEEYDSEADWHRDHPNPAYYRPHYDDQATAYQVYETVSEGTPVSPVFADLESLIAWLIEQGHSEHAARTFAEKRWAPSMMMSASGITMGIDVFDEMQ